MTELPVGSEAPQGPDPGTKARETSEYVPELEPVAGSLGLSALEDALSRQEVTSASSALGDEAVQGRRRSGGTTPGGAEGPEPDDRGKERHRPHPPDHLHQR